MVKKTLKKQDSNQLAYSIVQAATKKYENTTDPGRLNKKLTQKKKKKTN